MPFIAQQLSATLAIEPAIVLATAIRLMITEDHVATISVGTSGGTGYAVDDTFDIDDGTNVPVAVNGDSFRARARVTSVAAGVVTGVELISQGAYTTLATAINLSTTTVTGAGTGCQIDIDTIQTALWTEDRRTNLDNIDFATDGDFLATSVKVSNPATIGVRSTSGANDGIELNTANAFDNGLPWRDQPGSPPTSSFWLACPPANPFVYVSTTERRVNVLITDGAFFQYGGMGLMIPFTDVANNYPFPAICHAQATSLRAWNETYNASNRGILWPIDFAGLGCYQYRDNLSTSWLGITIDNNNGLDACRAQMWPAQGNRGRWSLTRAPVPTNGVGGVDADDMTPGASSNGSSSATYARIYGSFNEGDWLASDSDGAMPQGVGPFGRNSQTHAPIEAIIVSNQPSNVQQIGRIDGFEHVHGRGLNDLDEIQVSGGARFIVFPDTASTVLYRNIAMEII